MTISKGLDLSSIFANGFADEPATDTFDFGAVAPEPADSAIFETFTISAPTGGSSMFGSVSAGGAGGSSVFVSASSFTGDTGTSSSVTMDAEGDSVSAFLEMATDYETETITLPTVSFFDFF